MNPSQDFTALFHTKADIEPFFWRTIALAFIAAIFAATQRHDVGWNRSGTIGIAQRNPMICRSGVKQAVKRAITYGTSPFKIAEGKFPIIGGEIRIQATHLGTLIQSVCTKAGIVLFSLLIHILTKIMGVAGFPFASSLVDQFFVPGSISCSRSTLNDSITFWIGFLPSIGHIYPASLAFGPKAIFRLLASIEIFSCRREFIAAFGAAFEGCGIMGLHKKLAFLVPSPRVFPHRWDISISPVIIPQAGGIG